MLRRKLTVSSNVLALLVWMALAGAIHVSAEETAPSLNDIEAIRALIVATWGKPEATLVVEPVVVAGDHALAGWTQGNRGGRALLHKSAEKWAVVLCSGDPLKSASVLVEAGVPDAIADRLARDLATAERALPDEQVALFSTFEGVVQVDAHHDHDNHH